MYFVGAAVLALYGLLIYGVRKKERAEGNGSGEKGLPKKDSRDGGKLWNLFVRCGELLYGGLKGRITNERVQRQLEKLHPAADVGQLMREYYAQKIALALIVLLAGTALGTLVSLQAASEGFLKEGQVRRGEFDEAAKGLRLEASVEGNSVGSFQVEVQGQIPSYEEADRLEAEFWERAEEVILDENESWQQVSRNLELIEALEGYPFKVAWESSRPELIDSYGWVRPPEEGEREEVLLRASVTYGKWEWVHEIPAVTVPPRENSPEEELYGELEELLKHSEEGSRKEKDWILPEEWEGHRILWKEEREDQGLLFWLVGLGTAAAVFFLKDKDLNGKLQERERQMKETYPNIVNKLLLYLGAGLNVRSAFCRIPQEQARKTADGQIGPAYEEMLYTCHELQAGISEALAYERLGKRIGLQEYVRFGALLAQNLKKGNGTLLERLEEEAERSRQEQMNRFRQSGELVSTKLLVPMVMMLGIIMVMIMIPAFGKF